MLDRKLIFSIVFSITAVLSSATDAADTGDAVSVWPLSVSHPRGAAWERVKRTETSVVYRLLAQGDLRVAMVSAVDLQREIPNDKVLLDEAKRLVKVTTNGMHGPNANIVRESYVAEKHVGHRCVKVATNTEVQPPSGVAVPAQIIRAKFFVCSLPDAKGRVGYLLAFSYVSPQELSEREDDAEQFFRGITLKR